MARRKTEQPAQPNNSQQEDPLDHLDDSDSVDILGKGDDNIDLMAEILSDKDPTDDYHDAEPPAPAAIPKVVKPVIQAQQRKPAPVIEGMPDHLKNVTGVVITAVPEQIQRQVISVAEDVVVANMTYALVVRGSSTNGAQELMPLHEVPLLKATVAAQDSVNRQNVHVFPDFLENRMRTRRIGDKTITLMEGRYRKLFKTDIASELKRLTARYTIPGKGENVINLVQQIYGNGPRELLAAMHRIEYAMRSVEANLQPGYRISKAQMDAVVEYASPDHDIMIDQMDLQGFSEFNPFDGAGYQIDDAGTQMVAN